MGKDGTLRVGAKAPAFRLAGSGGREVALKDFLGRKNVVLYFYPKDNTPGCTVEACDFRDASRHFEKHDTVILGVSRDSRESHDGFSTRHRLPFPLLSDPDASLSKAYGVFGMKKFMGREFLGIHRTTFVIDKKGTIRGVFPRVKVKAHADEVLGFVRAELV
ncbi:MAG TPA: thioredoxin-dependent thiol peroxidase [Candidatus Polarisedimenticolia bacterium]|nr:thioredoxin-dependent thiol peroxidase [Candidatus Polarisedimenticolia bacterium]